MSDYVVLVNDRDEEVGVAEKLQTHREGALHRAISVFVFSPRGALLLQQRDPAKYHSGGLWSNTCCSHPRPGESAEAAAYRRLREEMGFECRLAHAFSFTYRTRLADLYEHEYDHVFVGSYDGRPAPDPGEVADWRWVDAADVRADLAAHPERYTHWFRLVWERALASWSGLAKEI